MTALAIEVRGLEQPYADGTQALHGLDCGIATDEAAAIAACWRWRRGCW